MERVECPIVKMISGVTSRGIARHLVGSGVRPARPRDHGGMHRLAKLLPTRHPEPRRGVRMKAKHTRGIRGQLARSLEDVARVHSGGGLTGPQPTRAVADVQKKQEQAPKR